MPLRWSNRTLVETAEKVQHAISRKKGFKKRHIRAAHAVPGILKTSLSVIEHEKYLMPIVFKNGTGTQGRKWLRFKTTADIDDGCMRSIALTINGAKKIRVYYGIPA